MVRFEPKEACHVDLPIELRTAIDDELARIPPRRLAELSAGLSDRYRAGRDQVAGSFLRSSDDIAAYAAFRLPATFAAIQSALVEVRHQMPAWSPKSLLDVGAGPGTVMWAADSVWSGLELATLVEREDGMIVLGKRLAERSPFEAMRKARWLKADLTGSWEAPKSDLVVAAYVLGELKQPEIDVLVGRLWDATAGVLVLIEPGTMPGFARVRKARDQVLEMGAQVAAPCPHSGACPIPEGDWCHFSQRVARSRLHRQAKGGDLGYEDEKFSYVALSRMPAMSVQGRVLRHPMTGKGYMRLELCTPEGLKSETVTRKDKEMLKRARDLKWGSAVR